MFLNYFVVIIGVNGSRQIRKMTDHIPPTLRKTFWLYGIGYLSILYACAVILIFTPIELILAIPRHLGFLYFKSVLIVLLCGYGTFKIVRVVLLVARYAEPEPNDKLTVELVIGIILAIATVLFTVMLGLSIDALL